jgi:hypothetical protein
MREYAEYGFAPSDLAQLSPDMDVVDFAVWYLRLGSPRRFSMFEASPEYPEVFLSDDATAVKQFVFGQFQVELYLIHPSPVVPVHEHPGVAAVEITPRFWDWRDRDELQRRALRAGQAHGDTIRSSARLRGFSLMSIQKWEPGLTPTTIAARWKGATAGPKHEQLIRRFAPTALVRQGYADVTIEA